MNKKDLNNLIGDRIRFYRVKNGWSQATLAENVGSNANYIGQLERGEKSPTIATLEKITTALGISLSLFFENISSVADNQYNELSKTYQLLLSLNKEEQKITCEIIEDIVKITRL